MQIHDTAFIVSTYRSYHESVSKDIYAKLWNNAKTEAIIPEILDSVSTDESILHSLRNRFFHESLQSFFSKNKGGVLINFGAGFSMYQFLLGADVHTIEIDKKDIIEYKKNQIEVWTEEGKLPERNTTYISFDFNHDSEETMITELNRLINQQPIFIVLEGVLFFLDRKVTDKLFTVFKNIQSSGDVLGSVSYIPEIEHTDVYKRLLHYFDSHNNTNDSFAHQTIPTSYYTQIEGYRLVEHTDECKLSKLYTPNTPLEDPNEILNEHLYLLERV